jgi:cell wall-associated NlpC family hydrolase
VAVKFALAQLGKPYQWGADGPRSFDCSGLVQTSYRAAGVHLPRVSRQQYGAGKLVSLRSLRAGDLLFYARDTSDRRTIYHVGMYLGAGRMVEAPNRRCVAVDGEFGPRTRAAVIAFQRDHGLTPDGVVGKGTWGKLVSHGRQRSPARC